MIIVAMPVQTLVGGLLVGATFRMAASSSRRLLATAMAVLRRTPAVVGVST